MTPLVAILVVSLVFYVVIPGIGAFGVRRRWRRFRASIVEASTFPRISYSLIHRSGSDPITALFLGALESIQGDSMVWLQSEGLTIAADMTGCEIFVLEGADPEPEETPPIRTTWERLGSLPAGTRVLVAGVLDTSGPHPLLRSAPDQPLLTLFYDGPERSLLRRSVWSGRQRNEYWNSVTPGSLVFGSLALVLIGYLLLRQPALVGFARLALVLASTPILALLPPGVLLFYLYRLVWRRGRRLRARRDTLQLPLRYFSGSNHSEVRFESGELYREVDLPATAVPALVSAGLHISQPPPPIRPERPESYHVYGRPEADAVFAPSEPLAEFVAVPGDPRELSHQCARRARSFEVAAAGLFALAMAVNYLLLLFIVVRLV